MYLENLNSFSADKNEQNCANEELRQLLNKINNDTVEDYLDNLIASEKTEYSDSFLSQLYAIKTENRPKVTQKRLNYLRNIYPQSSNHTLTPWMKRLVNT